jgi:hypothetical protein
VLFGLRHGVSSLGLNEVAVYLWKKRNPALLKAVTQVEAAARTEKLRLLNVAACRGNVQAITWLLERLEPQLFGKVATDLLALLTTLLDRLDAGERTVRPYWLLRVRASVARTCSAELAFRWA